MESKLIENQDYELIPAPSDPQAWHVRYLSGDFIETIVQYGRIRVDGKKDDPHLIFDFNIISSPHVDITENDEALQSHAADVLVAIIENGINNKELQMKESQ